MEKNKEKRRSYEPPVLKKVDLKAEEVLAVGCKTATGTGPAATPCAAAGCAAEGS